jgi:hypothetical protein
MKLIHIVPAVVAVTITTTAGVVMVTGDTGRIVNVLPATVTGYTVVNLNPGVQQKLTAAELWKNLHPSRDENLSPWGATPAAVTAGNTLGVNLAPIVNDMETIVRNSSQIGIVAVTPTSGVFMFKPRHEDAETNTAVERLVTILSVASPTLNETPVTSWLVNGGVTTGQIDGWTVVGDTPAVKTITTNKGTKLGNDPTFLTETTEQFKEGHIAEVWAAATPQRETISSVISLKNDGVTIGVWGPQPTANKSPTLPTQPLQLQHLVTIATGTLNERLKSYNVRGEITTTTNGNHSTTTIVLRKH